ncbi:MAG TPA: IS21-like element helper ATPase IstB [Candidatus Kapabacteria bacterium]|nr:IS21-like element helper ATPase IstB [Candidatus Kapabacteria bacterium]
MTTIADTSPLAALVILLRSLKMPTIARHAEEVAQLAEREGWTFVRYLHHLVELEVQERRRRRIERNLRQSELPSDKTLATLKRSRLPTKVAKMLPTLCEGGFVGRGDNLLAFGRPGRGKTHLVCAIGHELIHRGYRVLFIATYALVQRLLAAKRDLRLEEELGILDSFDAVILDDIGYVQQNRDEMEVLFTFLAERYERRTVMITSNLVFSEWDRIFKDPMTTAAAIDRLVHHSVILEMTGSSIRIEEAQAGRSEGGFDPNQAPTTTTPTTTTEETSPTTTTNSKTSTTTPTCHPIPGTAPMAPDPATTDHQSTKGETTNDRRQQIKQRVQQRQSEADGEM